MASRRPCQASEGALEGEAAIKSRRNTQPQFTGDTSLLASVDYRWTDEGIKWVNRQSAWERWGSPVSGSQMSSEAKSELSSMGNGAPESSMIHSLLHTQIKVIPPVCLDDAEWTDSKWGGKSTCRDMFLEAIMNGDCTKFKDYSIEVQQACPLSCRICAGHPYVMSYPLTRRPVKVANTNAATFTTVPLFVWQAKAGTHASRSPLLKRIEADGGFNGLHFHKEVTTAKAAGILPLQRLGEIVLLSTTKGTHLYPHDMLLAEEGHKENCQVVFEAEMASFPTTLPVYPLHDVADAFMSDSWVFGLWGWKLRFTESDKTALMTTLPKVADLKFDERDVEEERSGFPAENIPTIYNELLLERGTSNEKTNPITDKPYRWDIIYSRGPSGSDTHYEVVFALF